MYRYAVFPEDGDISQLRAAAFVLQPRQALQPQSPAFNFQAAEASRAATSSGGGNNSSGGSGSGTLGLGTPAQSLGVAPSPRVPSLNGSVLSPTGPRVRATQVLLPVDPDANLPSWVFDRTPLDVKAAYASAVRKREQGQVRESWKGFSSRIACGAREFSNVVLQYI